MLYEHGGGGGGGGLQICSLASGIFSEPPLPLDPLKNVTPLHKI